MRIGAPMSAMSHRSSLDAVEFHPGLVAVVLGPSVYLVPTCRTKGKSVAYDLTGTLLEVCTCDVNCACCWTGSEPTGDACDRVVAWQIDTGSVDGVDVSGITLAMLGMLDHQGAPVKSMIFIPSAASDEQATLLVDLWSGKLGGPMADLARMLGDIVGVERTTIDYREGGHLVIGERVAADVATATPDGTPVAADGYRANVPELGVSLSVQGQRAVHGAFHFAS